MKYQFIERNKSYFDISVICPILGVKRSSYYAWKNRPESNRKMENKELISRIKFIHLKSNQIYGSPRIHSDLKDQGIKCSKNKVAKLMKDNNIYSKIKKKCRNKCKQSNDENVCENILEREFNVKYPNKAWVSDITYIPTKEGWLYLCIILDLYSRKIVGWSMDKNMKKELVLRALEMSLINRSPLKGLIFHSDRGVQYTSGIFKEALKKYGIIQSMSRKGNCWDNACAETFFHTLKTELVKHKSFDTRKEAELSIFEYIEIFYNRIRKHSYLGYLPPVKFEEEIRA
jgi:transposase InsO family protein